LQKTAGQSHQAMFESGLIRASTDLRRNGKKRRAQEKCAAKDDF